MSRQVPAGKHAPLLAGSISGFRAFRLCAVAENVQHMLLSLADPTHLDYEHKQASRPARCCRIAAAGSPSLTLTHPPVSSGMR